MRRTILLIGIIALSLFSKGSDDAIDDYLGRIKVGDPVEYRNLKIFPIVATKTMTLKTFVTMDEAMDKDWLKIKELGSGEVNTVHVKNTGGQMVFLLTGEMITGAKQDRMLKEDVLLPPKSEWVEVPVYCVEHGRWVSVSSEFKSGGYIVPNAVRQCAKMTESQSEVWAGIEKSQADLGVASGTGTVRANYEDEEVNKEVRGYEDKFSKVPKISSRTVGVVVTTGDRIICVDMFANNGLLKKLWKKLVKSYAMDAIAGEKSRFNKEDIEDLLEIFEDADYVSVGTPGMGDLVSVETNNGKGSALIYDGGIVHFDFFPSDISIMDDDPDIRLDFRRDQRLDDSR